MSIDRTDLPGVGHRFTFQLQSGARLDLVIYHDRGREIFLVQQDGEPPTKVVSVRLETDEACALAGLLCDPLRPAGTE